MAEHAHWQVQEAKQRFSEVLRAVANEGPQIITRHGEEVAIILDIEEYRRSNQPARNFIDHLRAFPKIDSEPGVPDVFDEIEAERKRDFPPTRDFESELGLVDDPAEVR